MKHMRVRILISKSLLGVAYIATTLQWLWLALLVLPPLIESGAFSSLLDPQTSDTVVVQSPIGPSPLLWIFVSFVTVAILLLTVITLIRLPRTVVGGGEKIIQQTAEAVLPVLTHHKKLAAKKRREISRRLRLTLQLLACTVPFLMVMLVPAFEEITKQIIITIGLGLAVISALCFITAWLTEPVKKTTSRTRSHASRG